MKYILERLLAVAFEVTTQEKRCPSCICGCQILFQI